MTLEEKMLALGQPHELVALARALVELCAPSVKQPLVLLTLAVLWDIKQGSTRTPVLGAVGSEHLSEMFAPLIPAQQLQELLSSLEDELALHREVGLVGETAPLRLEGDHLYTQRMYTLEVRLCERIKAHPKLTLITGGPGTGKTSKAKALIQELIDQGVTSIALAAPTGKAAHRLAEAIGPKLAARYPPKTLHRLLGYTSSGQDVQSQLVEQAVIVDEASMIDMAIMDRLLGALSEEAQLVLIGDKDQLPPVESGAVLRTLTESEVLKGRVVELSQSHRQKHSDRVGRAIASAAKMVNQGRAPAIHFETHASAIRFEAVEGLQSAARQDFILRWYQAHFLNVPDLQRRIHKVYRPVELDAQNEDIEALLDTFSRFKLLCVADARGLNKQIHQLLLEDAGSSALKLLPGEPVMMQKNDYERGLFNGDQGVTLSVASHGAPQHMVIFRGAGGYRVFHPGSLLDDLSLAHAMTIHKSQGSEFDHVALMLPAKDHPLLTKELIYTAMTRAKRSVTVVGEPALLERAVLRKLERQSGLLERLRQTHEPSAAHPSR